MFTLKEIEAYIKNSGVDLKRPQGDLMYAYMTASLTCRFSLLHCYSFDTEGGFFPLELEKAGFNSPWCDDRNYTVRHRTRSFIDGNLRLGRSRQPLLPGETRELAVLIYQGDPCGNAAGNFNVLMAFGDPTPNYNPNIVDNNSYLFGLNFLPLVLVGAEVDHKDDSVFKMWGSPSLYMSTARVMKGTHGRNTTDYARGMHINTLTEYVAGVRSNLSLFPMQMSFEVLHAEMQRVRTRSALKLKSAFGCDSKKSSKDDVALVNVALDTALSVAEVATIGAFIDLHATDSFKGVTVSFLSNPSVAPLFICCCVLVAGNPSLADSNAAQVPAAARIYKSFLSLVPQHCSQGGSCLEIAIITALDAMKRSDGEDGASQAEGLNLSQRTCIEHMRKMGVALCLELAGQCPPVVEYYRVASRDARHRTLLKLMSDVNTWIKTGVWRERVITASSAPEDIAAGVNSTCFDLARIKIVHFFACGAYATADNHAVVIPSSPEHSTVECKKCAKTFSTNTIITQTGSVFGCTRCHALFCRDCCDDATEQTSKLLEGGAKKVAGDASEYRAALDAVWQCVTCKKEQASTQLDAEKKKKKKKAAAV